MLGCLALGESGDKYLPDNALEKGARNTKSATDIIPFPSEVLQSPIVSNLFQDRTKFNFYLFEIIAFIDNGNDMTS